MRTINAKVTKEVQGIYNALMEKLEQDTIRAEANALDKLSHMCHTIAAARGWWSNKDGTALERNVGEAMALMHSEISEAMEGARKDLPAEHIPGFLAVEEELADAIVRILDFSAGAKLRIAEAFAAKMIYNMTREDHSMEVRAQAGGKDF